MPRELLELLTRIRMYAENWWVTIPAQGAAIWISQLGDRAAGGQCRRCETERTAENSGDVGLRSRVSAACDRQPCNLA